MLISGGFPINTRIGIEFNIDTDIQKLSNCFSIAEKFLDNITTLKEVSCSYDLFKNIFNVCFALKTLTKNHFKNNDSSTLYLLLRLLLVTVE